MLRARPHQGQGAVRRQGEEALPRTDRGTGGPGDAERTRGPGEDPGTRGGPGDQGRTRGDPETRGLSPKHGHTITLCFKSGINAKISVFVLIVVLLSDRNDVPDAR